MKIYSVKDIVIITDKSDPHYNKVGPIISSHSHPEVGQRCAVRIPGESSAIWVLSKDLAKSA